MIYMNIGLFIGIAIFIGFLMLYFVNRELFLSIIEDTFLGESVEDINIFLGDDSTIVDILRTCIVITLYAALCIVVSATFVLASMFVWPIWVFIGVVFVWIYYKRKKS